MIFWAAFFFANLSRPFLHQVIIGFVSFILFQLSFHFIRYFIASTLCESAIIDKYANFVHQIIIAIGAYFVHQIIIAIGARMEAIRSSLVKTRPV